MHDPQLRIATQLLSGTLYQTQQKTPEQRSQDLEFALELAAELLSKQRRSKPPLDTMPHEAGVAPGSYFSDRNPHA